MRVRTARTSAATAISEPAGPSRRSRHVGASTARHRIITRAVAGTAVPFTWAPHAATAGVREAVAAAAASRAASRAAAVWHRYPQGWRGLFLRLARGHKSGEHRLGVRDEDSTIEGTKRSVAILSTREKQERVRCPALPLLSRHLLQVCACRCWQHGAQALEQRSISPERRRQVAQVHRLGPAVLRDGRSAEVCSRQLHGWHLGHVLNGLEPTCGWDVKRVGRRGRRIRLIAADVLANGSHVGEQVAPLELFLHAARGSTLGRRHTHLSSNTGDCARCQRSTSACATRFL